MKRFHLPARLRIPRTAKGFTPLESTPRFAAWVRLPIRVWGLMPRARSLTGFTIIEVLVVLFIIGLLSSMILASLSDARVKARDARRKADLQQVRLALELYYSEYGSYLVSGTGYLDCGCGWLNYEDGGDYLISVTRGLWEEEFLSAPYVDDPVQTPGYMAYLCDDTQAYALSATLENPSAEDTALIQKTCNGIGANGTFSVYGKNYALASEFY